ncbi:MAG: lysylphosphatidylglycerol synthase transmembrane domain-containing protein [Leeuwenhoekiella sp.]
MRKKKIITILKTIIPLGLGFFLIWYSLNSATPEQRNILWQNIKAADTKWIWLSLTFGILSHISRAYRWKFMLEPMGYNPRFLNRFMAVMVAYLANLGIPRSGEVLRGATLTTYEKIPFEKAFGTIISERIADFIMLMLVVAIAIILQSENLLDYLESSNINPLFTGGILLILVLLLLLFLKIIQRSSNPFITKVRNFFTGLLEGMRSILHMKHKIAFIAHTVFIWVMYVLMFGVIKFTIPEISAASFSVMLGAFVVGSFSISATNGGIGVYPIAIGAFLVFFGFSKEASEAFGWIVWGSQTLLVIVIGALSFLFLPIFNRDREALHK